MEGGRERKAARISSAVALAVFLAGCDEEVTDAQIHSRCTEMTSSLRSEDPARDFSGECEVDLRAARTADGEA